MGDRGLLDAVRALDSKARLSENELELQAGLINGYLVLCRARPAALLDLWDRQPDALQCEAACRQAVASCTGLEMRPAGAAASWWIVQCDAEPMPHRTDHPAVARALRYPATLFRQHSCPQVLVEDEVHGSLLVCNSCAAGDLEATRAHWTDVVAHWNSVLQPAGRRLLCTAHE